MERMYKFLGVIIIIVFLSYYARQGEEVRYSEEVAIPFGIGYDLKSKVGDEVVYSIPITYYIFGSDGRTNNLTVEGEGSFVIETRSDRQRKINKKIFNGLERMFIFSEEVAKDGIANIIDGLFNSHDINDHALMVVCKDKTKHILEYEQQGYNSSTEFIEGLIKNLRFSYFFSDDFKVTNVSSKSLAEGRRVMLPYIEITHEGIVVTGAAIFTKDRMVLKLNLNEAKIMNLLSGSKGTGELTLADDTYKFVGASAENKRKVKVIKEGDRYKFIINLNIDLEVTYNEQDVDIFENTKNLRIFKDRMSRQIEEQGEEFIHKMQSVYKLDLLELGRVAAAKYGRRTGVDWDEVVSNSQIDVNVNVKVSRQGKGNY